MGSTPLQALINNMEEIPHAASELCGSYASSQATCLFVQHIFPQLNLTTDPPPTGSTVLDDPFGAAESKLINFQTSSLKAGVQQVKQT